MFLSGITGPLWDVIFDATLETLYMSIVATGLTVLFGLPLGIYLHLTSKNQILQSNVIYQTVSAIVNISRSIPFIITLVILIPVTTFIVGTFIGTTAAIVPLTISAIPFIARLIQINLYEIPSGLNETARSLGASKLDIVFRFLIPEALPGIVLSITNTMIVLVNYTALAGTVGGGGLGQIGLQYGYQTYNPEVLFVVVVLLIIIVQVIQTLGNFIANKINHK